MMLLKLIHEAPAAKPLQAEAPAVALSFFKGFCSSTPQAFESKAAYLPSGRKFAVFVADVLRATSTMLAVAASGAHAIAIGVKSTSGGEFPKPPASMSNVLFGGEKDGKALPGGEIGNSPMAVRPNQFCGKSLYFFSTNGARAVVAASTLANSEIFIVSMANIDETVDAAILTGCNSFVVVNGGFYQAATIEDQVCAGRIFEALIQRGALSPPELDDEARMAHVTAQAFQCNICLLNTLHGQQVARLLSAVGRQNDVDAVITGKGIHPQIWCAMKRTVLRHEGQDGHHIFIPSISELHS
jgi:2-phosphosulfolactate phosphatase